MNTEKVICAHAKKNVTQKNNMSPKDRRWEPKGTGNMSERCAAQANAPPAGSG